jgi:hypothetical protein
MERGHFHHRLQSRQWAIVSSASGALPDALSSIQHQYLVWRYSEVPGEGLYLNMCNDIPTGLAAAAFTSIAEQTIDVVVEPIAA